MNKVILIGRTTSDIETENYGKGKEKNSYANFSLAVRRDEDNTDFINCVAFGQTAEFFEKYVEKGTRVAVEGSLQTSSYQDKDGNTKYSTKVVISRGEFADGNKKDSKR